ncbi:hypothetical protein BJ878DRAFT_518229 [Calycina marina]|uniref:Uncharacterized protein n=1 Tax=Calycina marina TaxID=1763456 RepID=A0A9P7YYD1_9HELO|nr:hypothetical protein BJ878DRAFT_518229 [Calycina marina]
MGEYKDIQSIPELSKKNQLGWFRDMKMELQAKGVYFVKEETIYLHFFVSRPLLPIQPGEYDVTDSTDIATGVTTEQRFSKAKKREFEKATAKAMARIFNSTAEEDKSLYEEGGITAAEFWEKLKENYKEADHVISQRYYHLVAHFS